jgi:hypothetical protein
VQPYVSTQRQSASAPPLMEVYEETKAARGAALRHISAGRKSGRWTRFFFRIGK